MRATAAQIDDVLALSPLQEGLFALHKLAAGGTDPYSMQFVVDVDGPVDVGLLRRSAEAMLMRHPNLRAVFWDRDLPRPVQIVPSEARLPWSERIAAPTEFDAICRSERRRPFDLSRGPALRVVLLTVPGETRRRMIVTAHHILVDGWALAVFFTEMLAVYRAGGSSAGLPAARPYRDYIGWLAEQDTAAAFARWREYLREVSEPLMVADSSSGVVAGDGAVEKAQLLLSAAETARLRAWAAGSGLTLSTVVLFAWAVVLGGITDRRDVVFGTIVSGRPESLAGVARMVGLFINAVPVVHRLTTLPVVEQCRHLQRELSAMRDIGYFSLAELQREHGRGPLFDTLFVFENAPIEDAIHPVSEPDGTRFTPVGMESLTHYPLTVVSHLHGEALLVAVEAVTAMLPHLPGKQIGERMLGVLRQLPDMAGETPGALDILTASERCELAGLATRSTPAPDATVWEVFERQAHVTPDADALCAGTGEHYTYAELYAQACRVAGELAEHGVKPETVVALALPRSPRAIVAILAVLAAGGAYLPVDASLPAARIASMLRQADPVLIMTETGCPGMTRFGVPALVIDDAAAERISRRPAVAPPVLRHRQQAAYVIFTSGSTGEPKGVVGTNAALLGYFADHRERVYRPASARLGRPLRIAHAWTLSFDASWQPMAGLLDGHALHVFDAAEMRDADLLVAGIAAQRIDMLDTTPSMFVQLRAAGLLRKPLSVLALGGEAIDAALWEQLGALWSTSRIAVYNCYGPTETTVEAVVATVDEYPTPTIGTANAGTVGYVLDSALRMVPTGVVGELYLSGVQLTRGYVDKPALTATRYVADPLHPGQRMYRTGDLVRRLPHGGYGYLGRADTQVKLRGYRVEITEVEAALREHPAVADAAVSVLRRAGGAILVGFVVWHGDGDPVVLRAALTEVLPPYLVPARIVALARLPVNTNGKLDAEVLGRLAENALRAHAGPTGGTAGTETERVLSEVFAEQFNGVTPDIDSDFFALGVDSIVAISVAYRARRRGLAVSPRMVATSPTIRRLAAAVESAAGSPDIDVCAAYGAVPPLPVASWLFEYGSYRRFTHTVLLRLPDDADQASVESVLQLLIDGHDTLRSILVDTPEGPRLVTRPPGVVRAADVLTLAPASASADADFTSAIARCARTANEAIDPHRGAMLRAIWLTGGERGHVLLIAAHHLVVDVVSWHIMLGDVAEAWRAVKSDAPPRLLPELTGYRRWSQLLWQRAATPQVATQRDYWAAQLRGPDPALGIRHPDPQTDTWSSLRVAPAITPVEVTERLLARLDEGAGMREFLLAVTAMTVAGWRRARASDPAAGTLVALEGHGRADDVVDTDTTNTVGWFNTVFPVRLAAGAAAIDVEQAENDPAAARLLLDCVTAELNAMPHGGLDYGLLRYVRDDPGLRVDPQIMFSYLGRLDLGGFTGQPWSLVTGDYLDALPGDPEPDLPLRFALHIGALVGSTESGTQLVTNVRWSDALFTASDIAAFVELWQRGVAALAACLDAADRSRHG